jgi:internalin A
MEKVQIKKCYPCNIEVSEVSTYYCLQCLLLNDFENKDISQLRNFISVSRMYLDSNRIVDLTPLKNLVNLKELNLSVNPISQQQIDELKKALPNCHISFDYDI